MPDFDSDSHGLAAQGSAGTVINTDATVANFTLPASPNGKWKIFGVWAQVVNITDTAAEALSHSLIVRSVAGDIDPNPAPSLWPIPKTGSFLGATAPVIGSPLKIHPVDWEAAGKAQLDLLVRNHENNTAAPTVAAGILFGLTIPEMVRPAFCDVVSNTVTTAVESQLGSMTLSERATRIVGYTAQMVQDGVLTTAEELAGFIRLDSPDIKMQPAQFPLSMVYGAGLGATIGNSAMDAAHMVPLNIPVIGGATVNVFLQNFATVTNAARATVYIYYV